MAGKKIQEKGQVERNSELESATKEFIKRRTFLKRTTNNAAALAMLVFLGANMLSKTESASAGACCWWSSCWTCSGCGGACSSDACSGSACATDGGCSSACAPSPCGSGCATDPSVT